MGLKVENCNLFVCGDRKHSFILDRWVGAFGYKFNDVLLVIAWLFVVIGHWMVVYCYYHSKRVNIFYILFNQKF